MYKIIYTLIVLVWIGDILNFPQLAMLDTTYPINTLAWWLIWIFIPSTQIYRNDSNSKEVEQ